MRSSKDEHIFHVYELWFFNALNYFSGLYNLFAALAEVVNAEMAPVLPKIVERMLDTIKSSDDLLPEFNDDSVVAADENEDGDIDIENSDDEEDDHDVSGMERFLEMF